ncbi:internalin, putative [Minicystis rosea]|nr:internalin, putative [Minicystis rosea]
MTHTISRKGLFSAPLARALLALSFPCVVLAACGGGGTGGSGGGTTTGSGGSGGTPSDACTQFVACAETAEPQSTSGAKAAFGPGGACFQTQSREACLKNCTDGLLGLHLTHPTEPACALCHTDADCSGATPACDTQRGECVACTSAAQCQAPTAACDPSSHTCVACAADADCKAPLGACDLETHTCVACTSGAHCASGACEADHTCCEATSPCDAPACGSHTNNCGKSVSCGNCGSGDYCDEFGWCKPITTTYTCNLNGHNNMCTKGQELCQYYFNQGGSTAWCDPIPAACLNQLTCACLLAQHAYFPPDTCEAGSGPNGAGTLYVTTQP